MRSVVSDSSGSVFYPHISLFSITSALIYFFFFFFNDTATTEIYTLSLHDALPIWAAIYQPLPPLVAIRDSLQGGQLHESISITSLRANRDDPIHGILLEGNDPHARVQIRLFGRLAYRVHFRTIAVGGKRFAYTHDLATDYEAVTEALE